MLWMSVEYVRDGDTMNIERGLSETLLRFYEAASTDGGWDKALNPLNALFQTAGATLHHIIRGEHSSVRYWGAGIDQSIERAYLRDFATMDVRVAAAAAAPESAVVTDLDLVPLDTMRTHPFYHEFLYPNHYGLFLCAIAVQRPHLTIGVSLQLERKAGTPSAEQVRILRLMTPHIRQAMLIHHELGLSVAREAAQKAALDQVRAPVFLVGSALQLRWANRAGDQALSAGDPVTCRAGMVTMRHPEDHAALARAVHVVCDAMLTGTEPLEIALQSQDDTRPIRALVAPAPSSSTSRTPLAILILCLPASALPITTRLPSVYRLTVAEDRLARHLAAGGSVEEFAECHDISVNTVRTHLKRLFEKTGTARQGELIALIYQNLSGIGW